MDDKSVFAKTIYAEARGEPEEGQKWVAWVIKNRAEKGRDYWGGSTIRGVCKQPYQFECWNGRNDIEIKEPGAYEKIRKWSDSLYDAPKERDPTGGCDHYNNPATDGDPDWARKISKVRKIGNHQFYKS
ncbi:Spore cortex-lytic enzyme [Pseudolycoriella hygida]|uniref:Spore cortex-lytic enzyme n=1 Tax=Pseudolycoriella hygida TaxID=35572 RepID=A0A9Q0RWF6_9DIPT|nr:Spore cortex-lytic enzyme [Pseudolycoriella hygida]